MKVHFIFVTLCFLISTFRGAWADGDNVVVVIDTNSTGITVRMGAGDVVVSRCSVLSVPSLKVIDTFEMGEDVAGTFIKRNTLVLTSQPIGPVRPETYNTSQNFTFYTINPFAKLRQTSLPGYLFSSDALFPSTFSDLTGSAGMAFAVFQYNKYAKALNNEPQAILGLTGSKDPVFSYAIPQKERFLTTTQPLARGFLLLHVEHSGGNIDSMLKLLDVKSGRIVSTLPVTHVRDIVPNLTPSDSCFAFLDRPGIDESQRLALITRQGNQIRMDPGAMLITFEPGEEKIWPVPETNWSGVALDAKRALISIGPNAMEIRYLYLLDYETRTQKKVLTLNPPVANFTVTTDGKYLITVASTRPQVSLYDLATYKLVSTRDNVSLHPLILIAN